MLLLNLYVSPYLTVNEAYLSYCFCGNRATCQQAVLLPVIIHCIDWREVSILCDGAVLHGANVTLG